MTSELSYGALLEKARKHLDDADRFQFIKASDASAIRHLCECLDAILELLEAKEMEPKP